MKLYNTLSRSLEEFKPLDAPAVGMYVCGPTVYDIPHIGHARSAYTFDVLYRYLEFSGYKVKFVRNVTDVDDKIIDRARQEIKSEDLNDACRQIAQKYLKSYHDTLDRLGIRKPWREPKATERVLPGFDEQEKRHIPGMTDLISELLFKGVAYEAGGDVYFAVRKFPDYGKLSNRTLDDLQAGVRVEPGEHKKDPLDFALWKSAKPGEPFWPSPWGPGRPGWHIECSLMSTAYLGDTFDIHGGGVDLVFPHHENEVAQAQAAGKPFARYWVHNGLLTVNGEKMSKSLGNYITVEKALQDAFGKSDALKIFFLSAHYRSPIDYTMDGINAARKRLNGILSFLKLIANGEYQRSEDIDLGLDFKNEFKQAMDSDLNTPVALAVLDRLVNLGNELEQSLSSRLERPHGSPPRFLRPADIGKNKLLRAKMAAIAEIIRELGSHLGLSLSFQVPDDIEKLFQQYEEARKLKDYSTSDRLRKQLLEKEYMIQDTEQGSIIIPK